MDQNPSQSLNQFERILIVDDSRPTLVLLATILDKAGYEVVQAMSGPEGLELASSVEPDIVLLDIIMPDMDGYKVCDRLKSNPDTADIPVVFLSGISDPQQKVKGLEAGAVDYITKPYDRGEVLARVKTQLKIARLTKELTEANEQLRDRQAQMDEDLRAAALIQKSLLPPDSITMGPVTFAGRFMPSEFIGGDMLNLVPLDDDWVAMYMLDVSGHGVPAALVTVTAWQTLQRHPGILTAESDNGHSEATITPPNLVMAQLDKEYPVERFSKIITLAYVVLNTKTGELTYSAAGHPPPIVLRADHRLTLLEAGGPVIGMGFSDSTELGRFALEPGDKLVLYTDGITEYRNPDGQFWGEERFFELLERLKHLEVNRLLDGIFSEIILFGKGEQPGDDISIMAVEFS